MINHHKKGEKRLNRDNTIQARKFHRAFMRKFWTNEILRMLKLKNPLLISAIEEDRKHARQYGVTV